MTVMIMVCIKDSTAETAGPILTFINENQAKRALADAANDPENNIGKHPDDYTMHKVGLYDDVTGDVQGMKHEMIARAKDLVRN